tara:strand:+ start:383 stop:514 length:132 start_codon:yes stop_codon:yes gene_type:complete
VVVELVEGVQIQQENLELPILVVEVEVGEDSLLLHVVDLEVQV